jgi:hypothetical protein
MSKLLSLVLALGAACLLVIACQTTGKQTQSRPTAQPPQATAQSSQLTAQPQQAAVQSSQPVAQPQAPPLAASAVRKVSASYSTLRSAASSRLNSLVGKLDLFRKIKVKLFGVDLQPTELMAIILAAVILLGGGSWTLATRRLARRGR